MPFSKERVETLTGLLRLVEESEEKRGAMAYRAVPHLQEMDREVSAHLAEESPWDKSTLVDSVAVLRYLAESYDRLGRFAVSARFYQRALSCAATLSKDHGEAVEEGETLFYRGLKARNHYVDDRCEDLRALALSFLPAALVERTHASVMKNPRGLQHDPVEMTEEYLSVVDEVEKLVEENRQTHGLGSCHEVWGLTRRFLAERGIPWRSPAIMNPGVLFD